MEEQKGNAGWAVLGFFLPLVGLILWLVWKDNKPGDAKMAGKGALIGVVIEVVIGVIAIIATSCVAASAMGAANDLANDMLDRIPAMISF